MAPKPPGHAGTETALAVETATADDADELVALRDRVATWLVRSGIQQWLPGEVTAERLRPWLTAGSVHVVRSHGRIRAAVAVLWEDQDIWGVQHEPAGYVHLLMVDRAHAGGGLGRALLSWAERRVWERGIRLVRLDAAATNRRLRAWYEAAGYRAVGTKRFGHPKLFDTTLFERRLDGR